MRPFFINPKRASLRPDWRPTLERLEERELLTITGTEMELVYILNRARNNPVQYQVEYQVQVDLVDIVPRPPLAVNESLSQSAQVKSDEMAAFSYFAHQSPVTGFWPNRLARDAGYPLPGSFLNSKNNIESIAAGTITSAETLRLLIEDVGIDPPTHRIQLLATSPFFANHREIGVGFSFVAQSTYRYYWGIHTAYAQTADTFLTGIVFHDLNANGRFDAGEGIAGATVSLAAGGATQTNAGGGWSLPVAAGTHTVTVTGSTFSGSNSTTLTVATGQNRSVDFISGRSAPIIDFDVQNTAPVLSAGNPELRAIWEDAVAPEGTPVAELVAPWVFDADPGSHPGIAITALAGTTSGTWQFSTNGGLSYQNIGIVNSTSALLLRQEDWVRFVPKPDFAGTVSLSFVAWDRSFGVAGNRGGTTFRGFDNPYSTTVLTATLDVLNINDAPVLTSGRFPTLTPTQEDSTGPVGSMIHTFAVPGIWDPDPMAAYGIAIVAADSANGTWQYSLGNGSQWANLPPVSASSAFLLRSADWIRFVPKPNFHGTVSFNYHAWDQTQGQVATAFDISQPGSTGGTTAFSIAQETGLAAVTPVNDAPVLDANRPLRLPDVAINATSTTNIADLLTSAGAPVITDVDANAKQGIALVGANASWGTWQYSLDGGSTWTALPAVSDAAALLLPSSTTHRLRFIPNPNAHGTASLAFRAWDQSSGTAGTFVPITSPGGSSAFSQATGTITVTVPGTNHAPTLDSEGQWVLPDLALGQSSGSGMLIADLLDSAGPGRIADADLGAMRGIAVVHADTTNGAWQYSTNGGTQWFALGNMTETNARLLADHARIRFVPQVGFVGTATIRFRAWDQSSGSNGGITNTAIHGGSTAFSTAIGTVTQRVGQDTTPPWVEAIYLAGSTWSESFRNGLVAENLGHSTLGYRVPTGSEDQLTPLPWNNIDQVRIVFGEPVDVVATDLAVFGVLNNPSIGSFSYDTLLQVATWTFSAPLARDAYRLVLSDRITDLAGNALDGDWLDGVSTRSGDGQAGGAFRFRLNILPGNVVTTDQIMSAIDWNFMRGRLFATVGSADYSPFADINGSGTINAIDWNAVRSVLFTSLAGLGEPGGGDQPVPLAEPTAILGPTSLRDPIASAQKSIVPNYVSDSALEGEIPPTQVNHGRTIMPKRYRDRPSAFALEPRAIDAWFLHTDD